MGQSTEKPVIVEALDLTFRTIEERTKQYRRLIISVSIAATGSSLLAIFLRQWLFLAGVIVVVPLVGGFFFFDSRIVRRWTCEILRMNRSCNLDLAIFSKTAGELRRPFPATLHNMLRTISIVQRLTDPELARFNQQQQRLERRIAGITLLLSLTLGLLIVSMFYRSLPLFLGGIGVVISLLVLRQRRQRNGSS